MGRLETGEGQRESGGRGRGGRGGRRVRSAHRPAPTAAGYRSSVTLVQKGCWTGPPRGQMQSNEDALPPDYSVIRGCTTDWCNAVYMTHDTVPNLSPGARGRGQGRGRGRGPGAPPGSRALRPPQLAGRAPWGGARSARPRGDHPLRGCPRSLPAPNPPTLSGTECYACVGTRPEDCAPRKSRRVQCHQDQSVCFQGNGEMSVGERLGAGAAGGWAGRRVEAPAAQPDAEAGP